MLKLIKKSLSQKNIIPKFRLLLSIAAIGYVIVSSTSNAATCGAYTTGNPTINTNFKFQRGNSNFDGQSLYENGHDYNFVCGGTYNVFHYEGRVSGPQNHDGTYPTDIPGIAIKYSIKPDGHCTPDPQNPLKGYCQNNPNLTKPTKLIPIISLQSRAGLPTGNISISSEFHMFYRTDYGRERQLGTVFSGNFNFTFTRFGCMLDTPNLVIPIGQVKSNNFAGVSSTLGRKTSTIELTCDPDTKYFLQVDGNGEPGHQGVMKLTPDPGAATGVGVQLLANGQPVEFGRAKQMGTSAASGNNIKETIDITAQYYQTQNRVTPGPANASATFTMTYQ
ncbi:MULTISPECIES: fimbrial protein [Yersinia]|jgi:type 1 fimbria pilin|uniref:fimbrial protein n=1 Tax=Yersinia TaxID=629 RepID=UPI000BFC9B3A|nr:MULTISPECIES: fimbrial protein [Yersinia]ATM86892.1 hypothetical protein CRN74_12885 [Yersinia frederiksenii]MCB5318265.1 fimbrial protein [Yersinia massiliensis]